jgi:hypothetical protein
MNFEVSHDCCYARKFKCAFNNQRHFLLYRVWILDNEDYNFYW